jgi:hypothetical protein
MKLVRLKELDPRDHWRHEALHFTQWLAEAENLEQLGDEVGLDITLVQTEADVGNFAVDILAKEETSGKKIVVENQLEATDHAHLGQILTYAAGLEAEYIIWVVRDHSNNEAIEASLGLGEVAWQELPERKASRIRAYHSADLSAENRSDVFAWLVAAAHEFRSTFAKPWVYRASAGADT